MAQPSIWSNSERQVQNIQSQIDSLNDEIYSKSFIGDEDEVAGLEQKRNGLQKQLNNLTNSNQYIQGNLSQWLHLALISDRLSTDEKKQAKEAARVLRKAAGTLYPWGSVLDEDKSYKANGYNALAGILENRSSGLKAYGIKALLAFFPELQKGYENTRNSQLLQDVNSSYISNPKISSLVNKNNPIADIQLNNSAAANLGTVSGIAAQAWLNWKLFETLGAAEEIGGALDNAASRGEATAAKFANQWSEDASADTADELAKAMDQGYNGNWNNIYTQNVGGTGENAAADTSDALGRAIKDSWYDGDAAGRLNAEGAGEAINPNEIRFSQSSVNGADEITTSMKANGWQGEPIDVVKMPDGKLTSVDNTRVVSARQAGIDVRANVHGYGDPLTPDQMSRFATKKGIPKTWGEAIGLRIGKQSSAFRNSFPSGSFELPKFK
jgi:hypothetical protein